ncbi:MAG: vitamin K epoxide reductase family protein [Gemmatimonadales bacterium]
MNRRTALALLALAGLFVSAYLYLYKLGYIGTIACGTGGCETVQLSEQSRFMGVEVALIGLLGYAVLFLLAALSLGSGFSGPSWPVLGMVLLGAGAVGFTLYLKYLELFVIHAICRWCVGSAVIIVLFFLVALVEWRQARREAST